MKFLAQILALSLLLSSCSVVKQNGYYQSRKYKPNAPHWLSFNKKDHPKADKDEAKPEKTAELVTIPFEESVPFSETVLDTMTLEHTPVILVEPFFTAPEIIEQDSTHSNEPVRYRGANYSKILFWGALIAAIIAMFTLSIDVFFMVPLALFIGAILLLSHSVYRMSIATTLAKRYPDKFKVFYSDKAILVFANILLTILLAVAAGIIWEFVWVLPFVLIFIVIYGTFYSIILISADREVNRIGEELNKMPDQRD